MSLFSFISFLGVPGTTVGVKYTRIQVLHSSKIQNYIHLRKLRPTMSLTLLKDYWFVLFAIVLSGGSFSSIAQGHDGFGARTILKSWLLRAEELRAKRLIPKDVEVSFTTVAICNLKICLEDVSDRRFLLFKMLLQPQIITHRGYPAEIHHVTTDDGFTICKVHWL